MKILILSCSLNPTSRSRLLGTEAHRILHSQGTDATLLDLRNYTLPICDGEDCDPAVLAPLRQPIHAADAILMAVPIYNYDVNAAAKNIVEHTGRQNRRLPLLRRRPWQLHVRHEPRQQP